jgi:hypothetical protein
MKPSMNNATLLSADLATHVKIVTIAVAATILAVLVEAGTQSRPVAGFYPLYQAAGHSIGPGN